MPEQIDGIPVDVREATAHQRLCAVDPAAAVSACIAERRMLEKIKDGVAKMPFLKSGNRVRIEMKDEGGRSIFGAIEQDVRIR